MTSINIENKQLQEKIGKCSMIVTNQKIQIGFKYSEKYETVSFERQAALCIIEKRSTPETCLLAESGKHHGPTATGWRKVVKAKEIEEDCQKFGNLWKFVFQNTTTTK